LEFEDSLIASNLRIKKRNKEKKERKLMIESLTTIYDIQ
jgi:hypothetical protein